VLKWPDRETVDKAVRKWAKIEVKAHPEVRRLGYFGSYARGDWGVGSDLDIVVVVAQSSKPFDQRPLSWDTSALPVAGELLVYTEQEWEELGQQGGKFIRTLNRETIWIYDSRW
jgi:hypothetical protein